MNIDRIINEAWEQAKQNPEPWIYSATAESYLIPSAKKREGLDRVNSLPKADRREIQVYDRLGTRLRTEYVYGALSFSEKLLAVESFLPKMELALYPGAVQRAVEEAARKLGLPATWAVGYINSSRHETGDGENRLYLLFSGDLGIDPHRPDPNVGRYGQMIQHLNEFSFGLGRGEVVLAPNTNSLLAYYGEWDGALFARESFLGDLGFNIFKGFAVPQIETQAFDMAKGKPQVTLKGMVHRVLDEHWPWVLKFAGLDPEKYRDTDLIVANREHAKFVTPETPDIINMGIWGVTKPIESHVATVSTDERTRYTFSDEYIKYLDSAREEAAKEMGRALERYAYEHSDYHLKRMISTNVELMAKAKLDSGSSLTQDERDAVNTLFDRASGLVAYMEKNLRYEPKEIIVQYLAMIEHMIKRVTVPGLTRYAFASNFVSVDGCAINSDDARRLRLRTGDNLIMMKYPNLGSGVSRLTIEAISHAETFYVNPRIFSRFPMDIDGDTVVAHEEPRGCQFVDNSKIVVRAAKHSEESAEVPNALSILANQAYAKHNTGLIDSLITRIMATRRLTPENKEKAIMVCIDALQTTVDMSKKNVLNPVDVEKYILSLFEDQLWKRTSTGGLYRCYVSTGSKAVYDTWLRAAEEALVKEFGRSVEIKCFLTLDPAPPSVRLLKGKCSTGVFGKDTAEYTHMALNLTIIRAWYERQHGLSDSTSFKDHLRIVIPKENSEYTVATWDAAKYDDNAAELVEAWEKVLKVVNPDYIFNYKGMTEDQRESYYSSKKLPKKIAVSKRTLFANTLKVIEKRCPQAVELAFDIHEAYFQHWKALGKPKAERPYDIKADIKMAFNMLNRGRNSWILGYALKYLSVMILGNTDPVHTEMIAQIARRMGKRPVAFKSMGIMSLFPVVAEGFDIRRILPAIGYKYHPVMEVLTKDEFEARRKASKK